MNPDTNAWAPAGAVGAGPAEFDAVVPGRGAGVRPLHSRPRRAGAAVGRPAPARDRRLQGLQGAVQGRLHHQQRAHGQGRGHVVISEGKAAAIAEVFALFDHVIESSKAGVRKPDPRIYPMMCEALGVKPEACVYLDDLGINLKPAREMGMTTIKVTGEQQLLDDLSKAVGIAF